MQYLIKMPMKIQPIKRLAGELTLPGDKSISHRAVMLGAISRGTTEAKGIADCADCNATIRAFQDMGIVVEKKLDMCVVHGNGLKALRRPSRPLSVGESGTTMRLLAGVLAGQDFEATLTGEGSLQKRPMGRIVEPLARMGADIRSREDGCPPLVIKGGAVKPIEYEMPVSSAQVKSAVLLAGLYASGKTTVKESSASRDHTERMLKLFGADVTVKGLTVSVKGVKELTGQFVEIPADISSASFFIVGATILKGSKIKIKDVGINPTRAGILKILKDMGGRIRITNRRDNYEPLADIEVESAETRGVVIEENQIPSLIDELPVIFVLAALSKGMTVIRGAQELRVKETDRIASLLDNLKAMGAGAQLDYRGTIAIEGRGELRGAALKSFGDHRTCMAMAIAALAAKGESSIDDTDCVAKSFPGFFRVLEGLKYA